LGSGPFPAVLQVHGGAWNNKDRTDGQNTALDLAAVNKLTSVAYPAISTGIYRFPADLAARIAVGTVAAEIAARPSGIARVVFCCFAPESAEHHKVAFAELGLA
jgi:O-acetyl-ADP-ribose deacetylase (regulator of RNase III)